MRDSASLPIPRRCFPCLRSTGTPDIWPRPGASSPPSRRPAPRLLSACESAVFVFYDPEQFSMAGIKTFWRTFLMKNSRKTLTVVLAIIYGLLLIWIILFKMSSFSAISELDHIRSINLIPFYYDREVSSHFSEVFENVILFIPMGIYLMIIIKRAGYPILFGACFSLALEISQYIFGIGASDITDLITNTTGTALGVLIYLSLLRLCKNEAKLHGTINILALICTIAFIILAAILLLVN